VQRECVDFIGRVFGVGKFSVVNIRLLGGGYLTFDWYELKTLLGLIFSLKFIDGMAIKNTIMI